MDGQRQRAEKHWQQADAATTLPARGSPLLEVQVVDAADSIAYDAHDADDALELGLLNLEQLLEVPLWREARERVVERFDSLDERQLRRAIVHEVIDWQVSDVLEQSRERCPSDSIASVARCAAVAVIIVDPRPNLAEKKANLSVSVRQRVSPSRTVWRSASRAQQALREMFDVLVGQPGIAAGEVSRGWPNARACRGRSAIIWPA